MFLFNNLTQGRGLLKVGVNPACTVPSQDPGKRLQALKGCRWVCHQDKGLRGGNLKRPIW